MPYLTTTSSSAVQDYVFKGDKSKGGFCVEQTATSKTRSYVVPTPFRETSLYESIRSKYPSGTAAHDDGMFQSQHSFQSFDPMAPHHPPHTFHHGYAPEYSSEDRNAYSSRSSSAFDAHSSQRMVAAPVVDHGGYASHRSAIKYGLSEFMSQAQPDRDSSKGQQFAHQASAQPPRRKYFPGHRTGPTQYGAVSSRLALAAPHAAELRLQPFDANVPAAY